MSVPKSALHCTQIFNVADIAFFGKFWDRFNRSIRRLPGGRGKKKANWEESTGVNTPLPSFFLKHLLSSLTPKPSGVSAGVMGKKEDHTGKSGRVNSSLSSISSLLWPLSQAFLEGKGEERTEQERQWQVNPPLSPHLHKISSLLLPPSGKAWY